MLNPPATDFVEKFSNDFVELKGIEPSASRVRFFDPRWKLLGLLDFRRVVEK